MSRSVTVDKVIVGAGAAMNDPPPQQENEHIEEVLKVGPTVINGPVNIGQVVNIHSAPCDDTPQEPSLEPAGQEPNPEPAGMPPIYSAQTLSLERMGEATTTYDLDALVERANLLHKMGRRIEHIIRLPDYPSDGKDKGYVHFGLLIRNPDP